MTVREALAEGGAVLGGSAVLAGSETARLDASLLLAHCIGVTRSRLFADLFREVDEAALHRYRGHLAARAEGRPVAYLVGTKEFYGRDFHVDENVLIPRPDTEILVEAALGAASGAVSCAGFGPEGDSSSGAALVAPPSHPLRVHELCTGSGAVAVTLSAERPGWEVSASDISEGALAIARRNSRDLLGHELPFVRSDLFSSVGGEFDLILANPPYVPSRETDGLLSRGWSEPRLALDGGADGLDLYRHLVPEALHHLCPGGLLFVESDPGQAAAIRHMLSDAGYTDIRCVEDLAGLARVTGGRKPWKI